MPHIDIYTSLTHHTRMVFIETPVFTAQIKNLLNDDDYGTFQRYLADNPSSLSDFGGRGENLAVRGQIFDDSQTHSGSMGQESAEIWPAQTDSQPDRPKPDRLLGWIRNQRDRRAAQGTRGRTGRGKRGGARVIYYHFVCASRIALLFAYPKNVQESLTPIQKAALRKILEQWR